MFHFPLFRSLAARTLTTLHGRLDLGDLKPFYHHFGEVPLVSISNDQRKPLPHGNFVATVHHGIPADLHRPSFEPGGYVAFLGRISPEKRPDRAIRIARTAGIPLKIAAKVDKVDEDYFRTEILPLIDGPGVEFIGEINEREKTQFLGEAAALLFPVDWPEPFGLVMIESMACGTPVLAFRCGSIPEVIEDGVTGKVVDSEEEAVAALPEILSYKPPRGAATVRGEIYCHKNGQELCRHLPQFIEDAHDQRRSAERVAAPPQSWKRKRLEPPCRLKIRVRLCSRPT